VSGCLPTRPITAVASFPCRGHVVVVVQDAVARYLGIDKWTLLSHATCGERTCYTMHFLLEWMELHARASSFGLKW